MRAEGDSPTRSIAKLSLLSLASTSIEWYDFFLYGICAVLVFPALFFPPTLPHSVGVIASLLTFAAGFVARPIGGLLFGYVGDRIGRKSALASALVLMGVATTLIGCAPTYATIGAAAPVILILLRIAQGLAIGGQWGGAVLLVLESAPVGRRGFYSSFAQAGAPVGLVFANLAFLCMVALTSTSDFNDWGWRLPFLASILLIGLGLYVHRRLRETPVYRELLTAPREPNASQASPIVQLIRGFPRELVLATISQSAVNLCFYINITYLISYGTDPEGLNVPHATMLSAVLMTSVLLPPMLLFFGALSDRVGRRGLYMGGAVLMIGAAFVLFPLTGTRSLVWITVGSVVASIPLAMMYAPQAALFGELFPASLRYSGMSAAYQVGAILGGGLGPLIATALMSRFDSTIAVSSYMAVSCLIALIAVASLRETARSTLDQACRAVPRSPLSA